jgi:hypothetical protein
VTSREHYPRATVASQKSKRKHRNPGSAPRAVPSPRRDQRAEREAAARREQRGSRPSRVDIRGERPVSPFGGLPISELMILVGAIAFILGVITGAGAALIVGFIVCALGVIEVTAREHLTGYRSHASLLAAVPAVGLELVLVLLFPGTRNRALFLFAVVPVFGVTFWLLRKRFLSARQARIARRRG